MFIFQVYYLLKDPVPEGHDNVVKFISKLSKVGVHLEAYQIAYDMQNQQR